MKAAVSAVVVVALLVAAFVGYRKFRAAVDLEEARSQVREAHEIAMRYANASAAYRARTGQWSDSTNQLPEAGSRGFGKAVQFAEVHANGQVRIGMASARLPQSVMTLDAIAAGERVTWTPRSRSAKTSSC
jgi:hypothetical protein